MRPPGLWWKRRERELGLQNTGISATVSVCVFAQGDWGVSPGPQVDASRRRTALQDLGRGERSGSPQGKEKKKKTPKVAGFQRSSNFMQIQSNYYRLIFSPDCFPVPVDKSHHADHV